MKKNLAWHFVGDKLRDGRDVPPDGVWLEHTGSLDMCFSGLHFSRHPFDALEYAPSSVLCLVEIGGTIEEPKNDNKGVCSRRKIIKRVDITETLRYFARQQALSVVHLWDAPDVVLDYLMTGGPATRDAAREAARYAARAEAWAATRDEACDAARDAARAVTRDATRDAARAVTRAATRAAQREYFAMLVSEAFA